MDIYQKRWTKLDANVFTLLCIKAAKKLSQREIAHLLDMSPTAVGNSIRRLMKDKNIKIEKIKNINFISLNRDEPLAIGLKRAENLKNIYVTGLFAYLERELAASTIMLFGSYALGEDTYQSDIDIAVIGRKDKLVRLEPYEQVLQRAINVNFYTSWKHIPKNLKSNILRGIILQGSVDV